MTSPTRSAGPNQSRDRKIADEIGDLHAGPRADARGSERLGRSKTNRMADRIVNGLHLGGIAAWAPGLQSGPAPPGDRAAMEGLIRSLSELAQVFSVARLFLTLFLLLLAFLLTRGLTLLLGRMGERRWAHAATVRKSIPIVNLAVWLIAFWVVVVGVFGQSTLLLLLVLVLLALVVGIASQHLLRDVVDGIVVLLERPFRIGDRIRLGPYHGEVAQIGLRSFKLLSPDGSVVVIPNSEAVRQSLANLSSGARETQVAVELLVPRGISVEQAKRIALDAAVVSPYIYVNRPIEVQIDEEYRGEPLLKVIVKAYVFDGEYERELRSDLVELIRKGFERLSPL
ncbi:MAG: mechanosensitive ion channel domain-containing protein [Acidobacteriota bacterium]